AGGGRGEGGADGELREVGGVHSDTADIRAYAPIPMPLQYARMHAMSTPIPAAPSGASSAEVCNCLALRGAARHVTQLYDRCLAPTGLRATQYSVLSRLGHLGPLTINALAA